MKAVVAGPITVLLLLRSYRRQSLTIPGIIVAGITATVHALPESPLPFTLLGTFFILGTSATKVKHEQKARLTLSSSGASGGEGPRTHIQVLANSLCASILCLLEYLYRPNSGGQCFPLHAQPSANYLSWCLLGATANYAATAADTLSSELGILSSSTPFLITAPWRSVPRGTNGGVTVAGVLYGSLGAAVIGVTSLMLLPFCEGEWTVQQKIALAVGVSVWGTLGSLLDSLLGAVLQASVVDRRTGKVVEGAGGVKVLTHRRASSASGSGTDARPAAATKQRKGASQSAADSATSHESRFIGSGSDILDNNGINLLMATIMTVGGIVVGEQLRKFT
ncbi:uncharacterized protein HMPREF1541_04087 [Cyphellophora europaea CBS 101466]|uniref:TIGR00297 family protein n=1 Tax=Cyphellophora europaea (strain CBS 101466) TaxID=1220924 RepID=W2S083_CYPE1|nr:uncharacterized protein HMPREF1541_04087 [Cyphellophora europaea CBS 101466]ETN42146.1 hypothetical protein HMPREF1541_04087 [Cyphellophora europaea CBS 101466]